MRKLLMLAVVVALVAVVYSVMSDPEKKEKFLGTIEGSTGVDLESNPRDMMKDVSKTVGEAVGEAAGDLMKDLGDTITDPAFHQSLEKWGKEALEKLDEADLGRLMQDLELESGSVGADYDSVLEKYLGEAGDL